MVRGLESRGEKESNNKVDFDDTITYHGDLNMPPRSYGSSDDEDDNPFLNSRCCFEEPDDRKITIE